MYTETKGVMPICRFDLFCKFQVCPCTPWHWFEPQDRPLFQTLVPDSQIPVPPYHRAKDDRCAYCGQVYLSLAECFASRSQVFGDILIPYPRAYRTVAFPLSTLTGPSIRLLILVF